MTSAATNRTANTIPLTAAMRAAPSPAVVVAADCPRSADELAPETLYGRWEARFDDGVAPALAVLRLARHPEYAGSVRGTLARAAGAGAGVDAQVAGDIDDAGVLTLDESADGRAIDAVWSADLEPGSCGRTFRGTRRDARSLARWRDRAATVLAALRSPAESATDTTTTPAGVR